VIRLQVPPSSSHKINSEVAAAVYSVAEAHNLDVWAQNAVQGWMDVMIPPHLANSTSDLFSSIPYHISIPDVQESIDINDADRLLNAKADVFFSAFQLPGAISKWIQEQANRHSDRATYQSEGQTEDGLDIHSIRIGTNKEKPTVLVYCGIHAREWITPATCCWIVDQILNEDKDQSLLDHFQFVIIPVLNVDGYGFTHDEDDGDRLWRKNRQSNAPASSCIGTDLNRNYAYMWSRPGASGSPCSETYYGSAAFSGPEAKVVEKLINDIDNLVSFWDLHAYSGLWMSAWGYTCNIVPQEYNSVMFPTMQAAVQAVRGVAGHTYDFGSICQTIYAASGSSVDHAYANGGIVHSYTTEAYGNTFIAPVSDIPIIGQETYVGFKTSCLRMTQQ